MRYLRLFYLIKNYEIRRILLHGYHYTPRFYRESLAKKGKLAYAGVGQGYICRKSFAASFPLDADFAVACHFARFCGAVFVEKIRLKAYLIISYTAVFNTADITDDPVDSVGIISSALSLWMRDFSSSPESFVL